MTFSKGWLVGAAVLVCSLVAGYGARALDTRQQDAATVQLAVARHSLASALDSAHVAAIKADSLGKSAAQWEATAISQSRRADSLSVAYASLRGRFTALASAAPAACTDVSAAADTALDASDARNAALAAALTSSQHADSLNAAAANALRAQLTPLSSAAAQTDSAAHALQKAATPSLLSRLAPKIGVGVAAGASARGGFDAVAGLTLGWHF